MAKWIVTIEEKLIYNIVVEADTEIAAEKAAYNSEEFIESDWDDIDTEVTQVEREWEAIGKDEGHRYCITSDTKGRVEVQEKESGKSVASFHSFEDAVAFINYKEESQ